MTPESIKNRLITLYPQFESQLIDEITKTGQYKSFLPQQEIISSGQYISHIILVLYGKAKVYRLSDDGHEFFMYFIGEGNACAMSMVCATKMETSSISALAAGKVEALMIPHKIMESWIPQYKSWYRFVVETYRSRFEELLFVIDEIAFRDLDHRIKIHLNKYFDANNNREIAISHKEIAQDLSTSREVVSRLLKKMEQHQMVELLRNKILLKDKFFNEIRN